MAAPRKRPQDLTGRNAELLAAQHAEDLALRQNELSLLQAVAAEEKDEVTDLSDAAVTPFAAPADPGTVEFVTDVEVANPTREFRVNTTLENVTIGKDNHYTFEEGRRYKAPLSVYNHLEEKGLIWH